MTTSDAPQPPGGPQRQDAADGPVQPSSNEQGALPDTDDDATDHELPPVTGEPEQSEAAAEVQEENAETSLDQPSQ
ncbi:hypothetical protein G5V58_00830 [Nocardioides anomalus]|uniref:Uncharacterized protein n=1 Tax=Nocardioides anomalus TaxID=2712223 RepID=A0A6G6W8G0_9ACTN|nr:hypothetical protein [Nocardioides anomalus]QIG41506.1 hypothetical protein G5V58_00830 [Nocardioides anomalus]